ncbi:MAG: 16S rRNA (cytidine(1402)-2'-O)-methyltransferase [Propionibacteriaceae bacterium]|nr:16S rRNA (cytidine(1402)-2'-O)-methyltransferase [Propionibacteriaceae bacterium]
MTGRLVLAGTPIGNLSDASEGLRRALAGADVIAAEDTRRLKTLLAGLAVESTARVVSYFDQTEAARAAGLVEDLRAGLTVLVVSDAGMPTVSDPGFRLVKLAIEADIPVTAVPGPSAVLTALAVSGLPTDRFCFEGFLPRKAGERSRRLAALADEDRTMVFFEAPHRLSALLAAAITAFGAERRASVSRELTKVFEQTKRGTLAELAEWAAAGVRGELTVCVAGREQRVQLDAEEAVRRVLAEVPSAVSHSASVAQVSVETGFPRKELYQLVLDARRSE